VIEGVDHQALLKFLAGWVGDDAEDVAQETYLQVLSAPFSPGGPASKQTWVFTIAKRQAVTWLRRRGRRQIAEGRSRMAPMAAVPVEWELMHDELSADDQALMDAKLQQGTATAAAKSLGLSRDQYRYRFARLGRRMR